MLQYVDHVIVPYVNNNIESPEQKAITIFDVFQAQRCQSVLDKLADNNIQVVFVPACCTDKLQPLDLTVNKDFKNSLNHQLHQWYSAEVGAQLQNMEDEGTYPDTEKINVDIKTSIIKPIHARWLIEASEDITQKTVCIIKGFLQSGLKENGNKIKNISINLCFFVVD